MPESCPAEFIDLATRLSDTARDIAARYFRKELFSRDQTGRNARHHRRP